MLYKINFVYINREFFYKHNFIEILDMGNIEKAIKRKYAFLSFKYEDNNILIPLRTVLPSYNFKIGFPLPTPNKPYAGLDYRKILIINNASCLSYGNKSIPRSQMRLVQLNYKRIEKETKTFIDEYIEKSIKGIEFYDKRFKYSSLHNFHKELKIDEKILKKELENNLEHIDKVKRKENENEI